MKTLTTTVTENRTIITMRDAILGVSALGFGISFPHIFHTFGLGSAFLPMYLPILTLGLLSTPLVIISVGIITPLISYLLSGMPPIIPPIAIIISFQLSILGLTACFIKANSKRNIFYAVITAVTTERLLTFIASVSILRETISTSHIYESYPGILLQIFGTIILYHILNRWMSTR